jgi:tripartite-type tricarboxylate transporter receptor subunit TctC
MNPFTRCAAAAAAIALGLANAAFAQGSFPSRPVRLIVPFPPAGGTDILARTVANKLTETLGWQIVVDNRPGAGGNIGLDAAAKATPDGYTMVIGQTSNLTVNPALYGKLPYDSVRDFAPVSLVSASPVALLVETKSAVKSVPDLIALAKAKPDQITFGSSGNGTVGHLSGELLQRTAGVKMVHVPYKGAAQAIPDLIGGRINVYLPSLETSMPHMKAGTLRAIALTSAQRVPAVPDVPTVAESFKGFEATTWFGLLVPSGTPKPIVDRLSAEVTKVLQLADVKARFAASGGLLVQPGPAEFAALIKTDLAKWGRVVKEAGIKIN